MIADSAAQPISGRTLANHVSADYFATLGVPIVRGRAFQKDESAGPSVAVISGAAARTFWPGQAPLGRSFTLETDFRGTLRTFQVIGIAADVRTASTSRLDSSYVYLPLQPSGFDLMIVRAGMDPRHGAEAIRHAVGAAAPALA